jgi:hypothetical protein
MYHREKRQPSKWEKMFAKHTGNKRFVSRIYKEIYNSIIKNITQLKIGKKITFLKKFYIMKYKKICDITKD